MTMYKKIFLTFFLFFNLFSSEHTEQIFIKRSFQCGVTSYEKSNKIDVQITAIFSGGWNSNFTAVYEDKHFETKKSLLKKQVKEVIENLISLNQRLETGILDYIIKLSCPQIIHGEDAKRIFYQLEEEFNNFSYTFSDSTIDNITKTNLPTKNAIFI